MKLSRSMKNEITKNKSKILYKYLIQDNILLAY